VQRRWIRVYRTGKFLKKTVHADGVIEKRNRSHAAQTASHTLWGVLREAIVFILDVN